MSQRFEWAHASAGFRLVEPDELADYDEEGNLSGDWGVWLGDEVMLYGSLDALRELVDAISERLDARRLELPRT